MPNLAELPVNHLSTLSYPRTGKRGVPQQFARRLYEMLQSEAKLASTSSDDEMLITWSDSGLAFRILDVKSFTSIVLPKYFRTKKFSSFQRNLNLYGFSKVRRGPDTDMYAHPSFVRGKPELLCDLRKCSSLSASRRKASCCVGEQSDASASESCGHSSSDSSSSAGESPLPATPVTPPKTITQTLDLHQDSTNNSFSSWASLLNRPFIPKTTASCQPEVPTPMGRLDLLALAVEHAT